jgi:hypothetical protein
MSDKNIVVSSQDELVEKWLPVIEGTGKWEKVVEGMPEVQSKNYGIMATQLECLEQVELKEATATGNVANYNPVLIPMVRRIAPAMIGNELFGVQPMTGPSGMIFALRSLYQGDGTDAVTATYEILILDTNVPAFQTAGTDISGDVGGVGVISHAEGKMVLVKMTSGTFEGSANVDDAAVYVAPVAAIDRAFPNGEALASVVFQNFSGDLTGGGAMATSAGEFLGTATRELGFEIVSNTINAKTRKLKTRWTIELEDDLRAVHGMNAEQLLSGFCGDEIVKEMNREFIDKVKTYAAMAGDNGIVPATWTYDVNDDSQGRWENEKYQALANEIGRQRRKLAKANMRGQATWMICTLGVLTALEATGRLVKAADQPLANAYVGTFDGMAVYVDMFPTDINEEAIYFGYKGDEVDAGMYFAPYVPLKVNKGYGEEDNIPRLFFSTRYGLGENPFGAKNYYQKLTIASLPGA